MTNIDTTFVVFIDYDNLLPTQKTAGILDVLTRALMQISMDAATTRAMCDVRVYGGWYEGTKITRLAEDLTVQIQRDFPKIIRVPTARSGHITVSANAELAVALLQEPGHHLFYTYRRKGKPVNVRVKEPTEVGCTDPACVLPLMKQLLKTGNCPKPGCGVAVGNLVYRHEQKIVDTMLSCDLIHAANIGYNLVVLVSGDDDFLPPIRAILLHGATVLRLHPKPNYHRATFPQGGAQLLEGDL
ncbi:MAG: hypothetical protein Q8K00_00785 [Syntrophales bacterium]|nr:hypothetical protein [Syntrophales bacterium]